MKMVSSIIIVNPIKNNYHFMVTKKAPTSGRFEME